MRDVPRDRRIGLALKAGSIAFRREGETVYAVSLVDIVLDEDAEEGAEQGGTTRLQLEMKIPADPRRDTIHDLTERYRTRIVALLRDAADVFDAETADTLLFDETTRIA